MFSKIVIISMFLGIFASLGLALRSLMRGRGDQASSERMARALTWRVGLSVGLFVLLFVLFAAGLIQPHGIAG